MSVRVIDVTGRSLSSTNMALDPRSPVLIGCGQIAQRDVTVEEAKDPLGLMVEAVRAASIDAGLASVPEAVDAIAVVALLSWRYGDPAFLIGEQLGISSARTMLTPHGGNSPQSLVNRMAIEIKRGDLDIAVLAGGETTRTKARAKKQGIELHWPTAPEGQIPESVGEELDMTHPAERALSLYMPVQIYPMFETAIRAAAGRTVEEQQVVASELWSRFSAVAAKNPNAWRQVERSAEEIRTPSASNRFVGFPYTKYMVSNNDVDMAAAVIICSAEKATELGVPRDRWVFIHAGTDCHEHKYVSNRWDLSRTPAIETGGRRVLDLAGMTIDDIDIVDLYSCFPSAVQLGAQSLGLSLDRQLTRTGGMPFAGGPWNNYVMHSIATVMNDVRADPGSNGLVWANGGYTTKHSFGIYSTNPPSEGFKYEYPQTEIDAMPTRDVAEGADAAGPVTVEVYTVMHDRDGRPETAFAGCLLADGRRAWGRSTDPQLVAAMCTGEWVGREAVLATDGTLMIEGV
jgi:acetyl-CoA C-acetyltransferase